MFRQWAIQARVTDDPVGDFIGDFRRDKRAPSDFESLDRLRGHLRLRNACPEAIEAAAGAWKRYQSWQRRRHQSRDR
jgi:YozE SAM-like protein